MMTRPFFNTKCVLLLLLVAACQYVAAFQSISGNNKHINADTALFMGKKRMAKRTRKVEQTRPKNFFDAIDDANDAPVEPRKKKKKVEPKAGDEALTEADLEREKRAAEARARMDQRPEVSTMIVDEDTGIEVVAQGKSVMDVVTRKAVKLYDRPEERLAQMFPGIPPDVREKYRCDWKTVTVPAVVDALLEASMVKLPDGTRDIPPHPSISNKAIDFVLANRDKLDHKMKRTLGRLQMRAMSLGDKDEALKLQKLWKNFLTLENHISAPFRQVILDAEGRVGPNFGNLDVKSYCNGDLYARTADYLVLKGMVAHWEKKVVDANYVETTPQTKENYITVLSRGDPKRYLPDPPILFTLKECTQVCAMSQQMTKAFVDTPELFDDLPPEVRFMEQALSIQGGTSLRQFATNEFCPAEGITPDALREGLRRLAAQLENMQIDPYGDITNILERLINALSVGTDDERDPYVEYLVSTKASDPGYFQTYTFNHEKLSLVRFLDRQYESAGTGGSGDISPIVANGEGGMGDFGDLFNLGQPEQPSPTPAPAKKKEGDFYKVPIERAAGRPHNLGWLDQLDDEMAEDEKMRLGKVPPGKIVMDE